MKTTPVQQVKDRFGDKQKLIAAVEQLATDELFLDRINEAKGLARVSNAKLLRLHDTLALVKQEFGSRAKLIAAILELEKRQKDAGLKARLEKYPTPRLLDVHRAAQRRRKRAEAKAKAAAPAKKKKKARSKKARAKARAA